MWAEDVADEVLALDEPWRGRFLTLVANLATGGVWDEEDVPSREVLVAWLRADLSLRFRVIQLLNAWRRPRVGDMDGDRIASLRIPRQVKVGVREER